MIIAAFPGTGKTYASKHLVWASLDAESSDFKWLDNDSSKSKEQSKGTFKKENPNFVNDYVDYLEEKEEENQHHIIFISTHKEVLDELTARKMPFVIVVPDISLYDAYIDRYTKRDNPESFVNLMRDKYTEFVFDLASNTDAVATIILNDENMYVSDFCKGGKVIK